MVNFCGLDYLKRCVVELLILLTERGMRSGGG